MKRSKQSAQKQKSSEVIERISHAARKEPWKNTVLQLAWTAGPVTYLALQGGYYLSYGKSAPGNLFIYFAIYTFIAGFFAMGIRFFYNATRGQEIEKAKTSLVSVSERLLEYIFLLRNINLSSLEPEAARHVAARLLLENPDAGEKAIGTAVKDLTGREDLAEGIMRVEVYRKNGLLRRLYEEREVHAKRLDKEYKRIAEMSRETADLLLKRFYGKAPAKKDGRKRVEGFIERIFSAGESNDLSVMSALDGKEMFILALECMLGREFGYYTLKYAGNREIADTFNRLDRARRSYRTTIFSRNSRLRVLMELCSTAESVKRVAVAINSIRSTEEILRNIHLAIEEFAEEIKTVTGEIHKKKILQREKKHDQIKKEQYQLLRDKVEHLKTVLKLYRALTMVNEEVKKQHSRLLRVERQYQEVIEKYRGTFPLTFLSEEEKGMGIKIEERILRLSDSDRLHIARKLNKEINRREHLNEESPPDDFKELAFEAAKIVNEKVPISEEAIMLAVEQTNSAFLTALEPDLSTKTKLDWAVSFIQDVARDTRRAAHRIASVLVNYHGVTLSEEDIEYLVNIYGGDREYLSSLVPNEEKRLMSNVQKIVEVPPVESKVYAFLKAGTEVLARK